MQWPRVGLVMIVKDEEAVIERALRSALPWINTYVIVDTGSTDGTKDVIRRVMADVSGFIEDRPWVNFGHNRTEALELCRGRMEWAIMLDADDNLAGGVPVRDLWDNLTVDAFALRTQHDQIWHNRVQIFRVDADWSYVGVLHEMPHCRSTPNPRIVLLPPEVWMVTRCEGVRSRDPQKYLKDALLMEKEYLRDPTNTRTLFYLAQSYRDANRIKEALHYYKKLMELPDVPEQERYMSYVNLILFSGSLDEALSLAWAALELCPTRLEVPFTLMNRWRTAGRAPSQQVYALAAAVKNRQADVTWAFVNHAVYDWGYDDEFAALSFATGHFKESYKASCRVAMGSPSDEGRATAAKNAKVALAKMSR